MRDTLVGSGRSKQTSWEERTRIDYEKMKEELDRPTDESEDEEAMSFCQEW